MPIVQGGRIILSVSESGGGGGGGENVAGATANNPVAIWYLHGQSERWPNSLPYTTDASEDILRYRFASAQPAESYDDGDQEIGNIFNEVPTTDADTNGSPPLSTSRVFFQPPAGRYHLEFNLGRSGTDYQGAVVLMKVQADTDDLLMADHHGLNNSQGIIEGITFTYRLDFKDLVVTEGDRFYFAAFNLAGGDNRGWMRLEKVA